MPPPRPPSARGKVQRWVFATATVASVPLAGPLAAPAQETWAWEWRRPGHRTAGDDRALSRWPPGPSAASAGKTFLKSYEEGTESWCCLA
ncbi:hypothetical protein [Nonomuraea recticatena]|uniref:Secreted protein n=1 Tax=Nonomuraea recticatena TaxID=46178 RepID=A0ABP6FPK4_9ACTN